MCVLRCVLLVCLALVHSDPIHESGHKHGHKVPSISFKWRSKFSMGLKLADGREDEMTLRHADTGGGVAVPCLFEGTLHNDAAGDVAVLGCQGGDNTQVTIVSKYTSASMFNIINYNTTQEILDPYKATNNKKKEKGKYDEEIISEKKHKRSIYPLEYEDYPEVNAGGGTLSPPIPVPADLVFAVELAYDESFLTKMKTTSAAEQYIVAVMTHAQIYLLHPSLGPRIHLHIKKPPKHFSGETLQIDEITAWGQTSPNMERVNTESKFMSDGALITFFFKNDLDVWMGVANRAKACDPNKAKALVKWRCSVQKAAMTTAHEIAHLLGPYHDDQEDTKKAFGQSELCSGEGLMSDKVDIDEHKEQWSLCNKKRLERWYNRQKATCLANNRLIEGVECSEDSNSWAPPCLCGTGSSGRSLCTGKHTCCEAATGTCLGFKNLDYVLAEMSWMKSQMLELTTKTGNHDNLLSQQSTEIKGMKGEIKELITKTDNHDILHTQQSTEMKRMKGEIKELVTKTDNHDILHTQQSTKMEGIKGEIKGMKGEIEKLTVCSSYIPLTDSWRNIDYVNRGEFRDFHCDRTGSDGWYSSTNLAWGSWYRFTGAAGTKLPTAPAPVGGPPGGPGNHICGTAAVAYISSLGNPTIQDGIVTRDVCFEEGSYSCLDKTTVGVAACRDMHGDYFVYQLQPVPYCSLAYCAID